MSAAAVIACESFFVAAGLSSFEIGGTGEEGTHNGEELWGVGWVR